MPEMPWRNSPDWPTLLSPLSDRPRIESLQAFLERLWEQHGPDLEFVVLFGSMARGDWSAGSDYDVFVGLSKVDQERLIDRLPLMDRLSDGRVEALPYSLAQVERMFCRFNLVVLGALRDGITLYDRGAWAAYRKRYRRLVEGRHLVPEPRGFSWTEEAERLVAGVSERE